MPITAAQRAAANAQQVAAAADAAPQIRLIAGPGTGKSATILKRVLYLLDQGANAANIYVISFTRAACDELRARISAALANGPHAAAVPQIRVSTMHSLALRINRMANLLTQFPHEPVMLDDWEQQNIYDRELATSLHCTPTRASQIRLAHDARWQTLNPALIAQAQITPAEQLGFTAFHAARTNLYSCLLPGEVVFRCVEGITQGAVTPQHLPTIEHLIVDEYQDLNACDQEFIRLLTGTGARLFIAGDDDQSIYSFRHANPDGIVNFQQTYPGSTTHVLTDCFRCAPNILTPASRLIAVNPTRVQKNLVALYGAATPPVLGAIAVWSFATMQAEAQAVAQSCQRLIQAGMTGREDEIVILLSNRRVQLDVFAQELGNLGLPFDPPPGRGITSEDAIRSVFDLLRITRDRGNQAPDYPAHRSLLSLMAGVGPGTAATVGDLCVANNQNFHALFSAIPLPAWLTTRALAAVQRLVTCANTAAQWALTDTLGTRAGDIQGLLTTVIFNAGNTAAATIATWTAFAQSLPQGMQLGELLQLFEAQSEADQTTILGAVRQRLDAAGEADVAQGEVPAPPRKIRILTMHGAKGLSGKVVFIPSAEEGIIPSFRAIQAAGLVIEQRRLFYVSLTRAMACCIVSHCAVHTGAAAFQLQQRARVALTRSQYLNEMQVPSVNRTGGLTVAEAAQIVADVANL